MGMFCWGWWWWWTGRRRCRSTVGRNTNPWGICLENIWMSDTLCFDLDRLVVPCSVQRMLRLERLACSKLVSWCTVPLLMTSCLHGQKPDVVFLTKLTALLFETHKESSLSFCGENCLMRRFMLSWQTSSVLTIFSSTPHDSHKMLQLLASASRQRSDLPWLQHKYNRTTFLSMIINGVPRCLAHLLLKALEKICQNALQIWL